MPDRIDLNPQSVRGIDLFPDVATEMDIRVQHAEQRIKVWILGGIAANLLVAILAAIPLIFYMGQASRDIAQANQQVGIVAAGLKEHEVQIRENTIWRARMEARNDELREIEKERR